MLIEQQQQAAVRGNAPVAAGPWARTVLGATSLSPEPVKKGPTPVKPKVKAAVKEDEEFWDWKEPEDHPERSMAD